MGKIVRVVKLGGALVIAIPRGFARELAIARRDHVHVERFGASALVLTKVEVRPYAAGPRR